MKRYAYRERDYTFGQLMLTLRMRLSLTQAGLAERLHVQRRAVAGWEAGSSYPKTEHLKELITLGVEQQAFPAGREEEEIRALWKAAHQKVLLDEDWLAALADQAIVSYTKQQPQVQLIALTTHGRGAAGRAIFGSVAEQVFASVPTSLLLLHPPKGEQTASGPIASASYQTIIVLLDGSIEAERALHQAISLAQEFRATLVLVAVPPRPGEEIFVAEADQPIPDSPEEKAQLLRTTTGLRVETAAATKDPEGFIEQLSGHAQGHLLVVATREQALYGAEKFLRHRNVPVLLLATYT